MVRTEREEATAGDRSPGGALSFLRSAGALLLRLPRAAAAILALGWMGVIFSMSARQSLPGTASFWTAFLHNLGHAPFYGLLALLLALALPREGGWPRLDRRGVLLVIGVVVLYGAVDELHQSTVSGRQASAFDVLTDLAGAVAVLLAAAHAGRLAATPAGIRLRLLAGLVLCLVAALLATLADL